MSYLLNGIYLVLSLVVSPIWFWRFVAWERIPAFRERLAGVAPAVSAGRSVVWFHAASVGEALLLRPLIEHFQSRRPQVQPVLSVYTREGFSAASGAFPDVPLFYLPLDLSWPVRRVCAALQPQLIVLSELELWPNLLLEARRRNIPVGVVSSRVNDADFRFFRRICPLLRPGLAAIRWWGAQTQRDAERIRKLLGPSATTVEVTGSLKYDAAAQDVSPAQSDELRRALGISSAERVFVAGSTHAAEEDAVLAAFELVRRAHPELRLILAPRKPARCGDVESLLRHRRIPFVRPGQISPSPVDSPPVILIDTVGELPTLWAIADFAFVGGTLAPQRGGQSMIEPAALGKPVCFGPRVWNFQEAADGLLAAGAARIVQSSADIAATLSEWLDNPQDAASLGRNAAAFIRSRCGASEKSLRALQNLLDSPPIEHHAERDAYRSPHAPA